MKVLQLGKYYPGNGGIESTMKDLAAGLASQGIQCDILCASSKHTHHTITYTLAPNSKAICTPTIAKLFSTMISPGTISTLRQICQQYDIIHLHHPNPMAALALRLSRYKGKVIVHWHSDILKQSTLLQIYKPLQSWMLHRADAIIGTSPAYISQSPFLKSYVSKTYPIPTGTDAIIPNREYENQLRQKYSGKKIIFSIGRLVPYKGFDYLIRTAALLPDDYVVLIAGSGPLASQLQGLINELQLGNKVKLLGRVSDEERSALYGACDLYCLSSVAKSEAFAMVQIEAMSCGKPVVATNIPESGVPWVNEHGVSGLNVEPQNPEALASAITKIISDPELYARLSEGAKERFHKFFTKETMVNSAKELYLKVLSQK